MTDTHDETWTAYLGTGETLLWTGAPERDTRVQLGHIGLAIFGAPFLIVGVGLFGLTAMSMIRGEAEAPWQWGGGLFLMLFSLPFAGAGIGTVFGPHLAARLAHRYVRYALSTRRAYIATRWWGRSMTSYAIRPDANVELIRGKLDQVVLHAGSESDGDGGARPQLARFDGLADGMQVYLLIRQIQRDLAAAKP